MNKRLCLIIGTLLSCVVLFCACSSKDSIRTEPPIIETERPAVNTPAPTEKPTYTDGLQSDGYLHVYLVGDAEKVKTPESSFIEYIAYYAECKHLIICMNGTDYVFANVSESLWNDFKASESKGTFYNSYIRGESKFHVNDYNGENGSLIMLEYKE